MPLDRSQVERRFKAMGGPCRIRLEIDSAPTEADAQAAIDAAVAEVARLENKFSRYLDTSLTARINAAAGQTDPVPIDAETAAILNYADTAWRESGGLFDLTSGVLRRAWDFKSGKLPSKQALDALLPLVNWQAVHWDDAGIRLARAGMEIDFGGCVKEYATDSAAAILRNFGVTNALVDLAGDMVAIGTPGGEFGWQIGIRHPSQRDSAIAAIDLCDSGLASSGEYERCLVVDGVRYGHILHPQTGWPVRGLIAVSVLAPQCLVAGSAATMAMLKPTADALTWLQQLGLPWLAIDNELQCHGSIAAAQSS